MQNNLNFISKIISSTQTFTSIVLPYKRLRHVFVFISIEFFVFEPGLVWFINVLLLPLWCPPCIADEGVLLGEGPPGAAVRVSLRDLYVGGVPVPSWPGMDWPGHGSGWGGADGDRERSQSHPQRGHRHGPRPAGGSVSSAAQETQRLISVFKSTLHHRHETMCRICFLCSALILICSKLSQLYTLKGTCMYLQQWTFCMSFSQFIDFPIRLLLVWFYIGASLQCKGCTANLYKNICTFSLRRPIWVSLKLNCTLIRIVLGPVEVLSLGNEWWTGGEWVTWALRQIVLICVTCCSGAEPQENAQVTSL